MISTTQITANSVNSCSGGRGGSRPFQAVDECGGPGPFSIPSRALRSDIMCSCCLYLMSRFDGYRTDNHHH